ncbi:MAG: hypothetical protein JSW34_03890 [Candidatus Zixiibacteriota bacterium]|nr:MAG: hypothetical protein JSW34_03890 [candidate division Zixibacteria bacterium]
MTERLYYHKSDLLEFDATIVDSGRHGELYYTALDRSAFYPTSGGQQHDTGLLNGRPVIDVIETDGGEVWHLSREPVGEMGEKVTGVVDKDRRQLHCQQHTAQHILSGVFFRLYGFQTVSVHLGEEYGAIELKTAEITSEQMAHAERAAAQVIADNWPVETLMVEPDRVAGLPLRKKPARTGTIRVLKIGDIDYSACGGTHCASTGGVGLVKISGVEKMRGRALVKFLSGGQAYADYCGRFVVTDRLSRSLTCHVSDLPEKLDRMGEEIKALRLELGQLQRELIPATAAKLAEKARDVKGVKLVAADIEPFDPRLAAQLAAGVVELTAGVAVLYTGGRLIITASPESGHDASRLVKGLAATAGLKGGGSPRQAQAGGAVKEKLDDYVEIISGLLGDA